MRGPVRLLGLWLWMVAWAWAGDQPQIQADLHLDTLTAVYTSGRGLDAAQGLEAGLAQLRAGGSNLVVLALWPPRNVDGPGRVAALLDRFESEDRRLDGLTLVRSPREVVAVTAAGGIAATISLEGAHGLGKDWRADLDQLQRRGLSMLGLTWSISNRFAGSASDKGGGLTEEGRALVARARELGVLVDVSHASRATTLEVCQGSPVPVVASHSGAWAVEHSVRNLSDAEITCIAATGGVIGLNLHGPFLGGNQDIAAAVAHLRHLRAVGGAGVVALGSDYDGIIQPAHGLENASHLPALWSALRADGWSEVEIRGVRGENFLRAWTAAWAARAGAVPSP